MNTQLQVASAVHAALKNEDWTALRQLFTDDARWLMPGDNAVSGPAQGGDAVVARAQLIAAYGMRFELLATLVSHANVALSQHNTADHAGRHFAQHVATVMTLRGDRIAQIETFVSDLDNFNRFFVAHERAPAAGEAR